MPMSKTAAEALPQQPGTELPVVEALLKPMVFALQKGG